MADVRSDLGAKGERAALDLYRRRGFTLVASNWRCSLGEIDLVLRRRDVLVFCEVKTRRGSSRGVGFEAVDARKRRKLLGPDAGFAPMGDEVPVEAVPAPAGSEMSADAA